MAGWGQTPWGGGWGVAVTSTPTEAILIGKVSAAVLLQTRHIAGSRQLVASRVVAAPSLGISVAASSVPKLKLTTITTRA